MGTNRKLINDFLLVINTNLPPILHRFSERELTFTFAIGLRPSVCRLSVTKVLEHFMLRLYFVCFLANVNSYMSFRWVPKSVILNGVMAVTLHYSSEFGKPALQKTICGGIYARDYCIFSACTVSS